MPRWFFRSKKRDGESAKPDRKHTTMPARSKAPTSSKRYRRQPAPLTWNDPEQDFITRYGDPFDG